MLLELLSLTCTRLKICLQGNCHSQLRQESHLFYKSDTSLHAKACNNYRSCRGLPSSIRDMPAGSVCLRGLFLTYFQSSVHYRVKEDESCHHLVNSGADSAGCPSFSSMDYQDHARKCNRLQTNICQCSNEIYKRFRHGVCRACLAAKHFV